MRSPKLQGRIYRTRSLLLVKHARSRTPLCKQRSSNQDTSQCPCLTGSVVLDEFLAMQLGSFPNKVTSQRHHLLTQLRLNVPLNEPLHPLAGQRFIARLQV